MIVKSKLKGSTRRANQPLSSRGRSLGRPDQAAARFHCRPNLACNCNATPLSAGKRTLGSKWDSNTPKLAYNGTNDTLSISHEYCYDITTFQGTNLLVELKFCISKPLHIFKPSLTRLCIGPPAASYILSGFWRPGYHSRTVPPSETGGSGVAV
jgi:hypothetical protein